MFLQRELRGSTYMYDYVYLCEWRASRGAIPVDVPFILVCGPSCCVRLGTALSVAVTLSMRVLLLLRRGWADPERKARLKTHCLDSAVFQHVENCDSTVQITDKLLPWGRCGAAPKWARTPCTMHPEVGLLVPKYAII